MRSLSHSEVQVLSVTQCGDMKAYPIGLIGVEEHFSADGTG